MIKEIKEASKNQQTHSPTGKVVGQVGQILLPMIAGIAATKADLTEWVYEQGVTALHLLLERGRGEDRGAATGKHEKERTHNHWGSTVGELSFERSSNPSVAPSSSFEVGRALASLPHFEAFREEDQLPERVLPAAIGIWRGSYRPEITNRVWTNPHREVEVSWHEQECRRAVTS